MLEFIKSSRYKFFSEVFILSKFAKSWESKKELSLSTKIKDTIRPPGPIKERLTRVIKRIELQIQRLGQASERLSERDKTIFDRVVHSYMQHDQARANIFASELAEIRKMEKIALHARMALEQIVLRLGTVTELGDIAVTLTPLVSVIQGIRSGMSSVSPQVERELGDIGNLLGGIIKDAGQVAGITLDFEMIDEDSKKILNEASVIAEQRMKQSFPDLPNLVTQSGEGTPDSL